MRRPSALLVSWIGVLAVPSTLTRFDGLPFSSLAEALAVAMLVPVACSAAQRRVLARAWSKSPARVRVALLGAVLICGALKLVLVPSRPDGFVACYESTITPLPVGGCERSFENPLFRLGATRIDRVIDFGPQDWDLSFFNSVRFNFLWKPGERRQDRLPFQVSWRGVIDSAAEQAVVTYAGRGRLGIDAMSIELAPAYDAERTVPVTLTPGRHTVRIQFSFDDNSRAMIRPTGPYATFRLTGARPDGTPGTPLPAAPPPAWLRAVALVVDLLAVGLSLVLLFNYVRLMRFELGAAAVVASTFAAVRIGGQALGLPPRIGATLVIGSLLPLVLRRHRSTRLLFAYFALLLLGTWLALDAYPRLGTVVYRRAGEDWLTYESHARAILETRSLEGAEPVFYMQPLFRYVRFTERVLLGDGDPLIDLLTWTALVWTILWAAAVLFGTRRIGRARSALFVAAAASTIALAGSEVVALMIEFPLSEHATWIFTAAAFALLSSASPARWAGGAAFLGAAIITRPNQLPALVAIAIAFLAPAWRHRWRPALIACAVFGAVCLLPLAHNLYYGGRAVIFTTTAASPATLGLPAATVGRTFIDATARAQVDREVRGVLFLPPWRSSFGHDEVRFVLYALQAIWLPALWLAARGSVPAHLRLLALVPALYLGVHLVYAVSNYYPRHILAGHFAMGFVAMAHYGSLVGSRRFASRNRHSST